MCMNVNGSQDGCALDCPTTEEGCVKATCCQTNNKVSLDRIFSKIPFESGCENARSIIEILFSYL